MTITDRLTVGEVGKRSVVMSAESGRSASFIVAQKGSVIARIRYSRDGVEALMTSQRGFDSKISSKGGVCRVSLIDRADGRKNEPRGFTLRSGGGNSMFILMGSRGRAVCNIDASGASVAAAAADIGSGAIGASLVSMPDKGTAWMPAGGTHDHMLYTGPVSDRCGFRVCVDGIPAIRVGADATLDMAGKIVLDGEVGDLRLKGESLQK